MSSDNYMQRTSVNFDKLFKERKKSKLEKAQEEKSE